MPLHRVVAVLAVLAALWPAGACRQPESGADAPTVEEEPGIPQLPSEFTNLEVLPADITKHQMKRYMKRITKSLGTKCDYCHRTDIRDYATDEIHEKVVAREMMRMLEKLNREHFTWEGAPQATCFMCHRGEQEPQLAPGGGVSGAGAEQTAAESSLPQRPPPQTP
jgi:hypothetical protein